MFNCLKGTKLEVHFLFQLCNIIKSCSNKFFSLRFELHGSESIARTNLGLLRVNHNGEHGFLVTVLVATTGLVLAASLSHLGLVGVSPGSGDNTGTGCIGVSLNDAPMFRSTYNKQQKQIIIFFLLKFFFFLARTSQFIIGNTFSYLVLDLTLKLRSNKQLENTHLNVLSTTTGSNCYFSQGRYLRNNHLGVLVAVL